jgi:uncharacterized protein (DUF302 family)
VDIIIAVSIMMMNLNLVAVSEFQCLMMKIYCTETAKVVSQYVLDLGHAARAHGFKIHNESTMEMAQVFGHLGVDVAKDFDLHMIQICNPEKAARSLGKNPERSVLMPKFIMMSSQHDRTQIRFLHYSLETLQALVDDLDFPASLNESLRQIIGFIEEAC